VIPVITAGAYILSQRIELQDLIRRLEKDPSEEDKKEINHKRNLLSAEFELVAASYRRAVGIFNVGPSPITQFPDEPFDFDNLDDDINTIDPDNDSGEDDIFDGTATIQPESRQIFLPSTCLPREHPLSQEELTLRKDQANRYLMALREVIAEKSFQYTHVIRVAPRKAVVTRARKAITKLNCKIAYYSRMYGRCRAALLRLAVDLDGIKSYRILTRQDVKASSAVVNPNIPGSTSLALSWIWQMSDAGTESPASLRECRFVLCLIKLLY
jgi:hypothetical protein